MNVVIQTFVFAFGAIIGSFLNAVIWRLHVGQSFVRGRSKCIHCRHGLAARDLVPVFSYLFLGGKCRYCRKPISPHYPIVETVTGLLFVLALMATVPAGETAAMTDLPRLLFHWFLVSVFVFAFVFDLKYLMILPEVIGPATVAVLLAHLALGDGWFSPVLGAVIAGGFFRIQFLVSRGRWIGGGDAWLGMFMGAALGWQKTLLALFLAYVGGATVATVMLITGRKRLGQQLAFGTFLSAAAVTVLLFGDALLDWYWGLVF